MNGHKLRRIAQAATVATALLILYMMLSPDPPHLNAVTNVAAGVGVPTLAEPPPGWTMGDEEAFGHAVLFAVLGVFAALWYATSASARRSPTRTLLMVMAVLWLFGGITELAQGLTATRSPELSDMGFDVLGAFAGFLGGGAAWRLIFKRFGR